MVEKPGEPSRIERFLTKQQRNTCSRYIYSDLTQLTLSYFLYLADLPRHFVGGLHTFVYFYLSMFAWNTILLHSLFASVSNANTGNNENNNINKISKYNLASKGETINSIL